MTKEQFKKKRIKLFGSQDKAAKALGVTQGAISHWETGARKIPKTAILMLNSFIKGS